MPEAADQHARKKRAEENSCKKKGCFIQSDPTKNAMLYPVFFFASPASWIFLFGPFTLLSISNSVNKCNIPTCEPRTTKWADMRNHVNSNSQLLISMCPLAVVALNYSIEEL